MSVHSDLDLILNLHAKTSDLSQFVESTKEFVERFNEFLSRQDQRERREANDVCKQDAVENQT